MATNLLPLLAAAAGGVLFLLLLGKKDSAPDARGAPVYTPTGPVSTTRIAAPPAAIRRALQTASDRTGVPMSLLIALAHTESRYNPRAVSHAGAQGLMQLMPVVQEKYGVTNPFNANQSALASAKMLRNMFSKYGNWDQVLAAYNWGMGNVNRKPLASQWPASVQRYVNKIRGARVA
jgi:soluble lytic murein transglycosylase-like protein